MDNNAQASQGKDRYWDLKMIAILGVIMSVVFTIFVLATTERNRLMAEESYVFSPCLIEEKKIYPGARSATTYKLHTSCGVFTTGKDLFKKASLGETYTLAAYDTDYGKGVSPVAFEIAVVE